MIMNTGTLNAKNEFGANNLCRLETSSTDWERERERKKDETLKKRFEVDMREFVNVMSNVYAFNKPSSDMNNHDNSCRSNTNKKKRTIQSDYTEEENVKSKRRRVANMNNHSTPGNQHRGNRGGMLDEDLISPIPQPGEITANSNITGGTNSTDGGNGARALTIAHTNISDEIAALRIGQRNGCFNDSSMELLVGFLNLEAAARDRGLLETRNNMHLEWLDIEGMTERLLLNINVDE